MRYEPSFSWRLPDFTASVDGASLDNGWRQNLEKLPWVQHRLVPFLEGPMHMLKVLPSNKAKSLYKILKKSELVDKKLGMYKLNVSLKQWFIHRTGHGIGLETHEEPYLGENNQTVIQNNMIFSIEPGFYIEGVHGARIEDIVICTPDGPESVNKQTRDLVIIGS